jgi:purine nucleoside permease
MSLKEELTMKKVLLLLITGLLTIGVVCANGQKQIAPKVLILSTFEGEAAAYRTFIEEGTTMAINGAFRNANEVDSAWDPEGLNPKPLYLSKDKLVALYVTGMAKTNAASSLTAILADNRFDWSKTIIFVTACAGGAKDKTAMGDVIIATEIADYDLGHHIDIRQMPDGYNGSLFVHDKSFDSTGYFKLNETLYTKAYELTKDIQLDTTEITRNALTALGNARIEPQVIYGNTITGDNFWKGPFGSKEADDVFKAYGSDRGFYLTEMEDVAFCAVAKRFGLLDNVLIVRDSVNMAVLLSGQKITDIWEIESGTQQSLTEETSEEALDIFMVAQANNYKVGSVILNAILDGSF